MSNEVLPNEVESPQTLEGTASRNNTREWDGGDAIDAFPGARKDAEDQIAKEYMEEQNRLAEQKAAEESQEEIEDVREETSEEQVEEIPEEAVEEPVQEQPVLVQEDTPRAQQRIQKLVAEKKEAQSKLEALVEQLAKAEVARQEAEARREQEVQYERALREQENRKAMRMKQLEEAGFDPTDPRNQYMLAVDDVIVAQNQELQAIKQELVRRQQEEIHAKQWKEFDARLDKAFESTLAGRKLDEETKAALRETAIGLAYKNNSSDPIEEVRAVLRPYMKLLREPAAAAPKAPPQVQNTQAHRAIALKGSTGTKKAGDTPTQSRPGKISMDQAREALWGSARTPWDR